MENAAKLRSEFITERSEAGVVSGRVVTLDPRIIIDEYDPTHADILWDCDHCGARSPVTAQFPMRPDGHFTVCRDCLQRAIDGIDCSRANPVSFDDDPPRSPP